MNLNKFKDRKHMDIILPSAIALFCVVIVSYIFMKILDNSGVILSGLGSLYTIISPFIYAAIIAYILNPIMKFFERKFRMKRAISILCTYLMIIGVMIILVVYLLPKVVNNLTDFARNVPYFANEAQEWVDKFLNNKHIHEIVKSQFAAFNPQVIISKFSDFSMTALNSFLNGMVSFTSSFIKWIFGFLISIYILFDKERFKEITKNMTFAIFKQKKGKLIIGLCKNLNNMIGTYIGIKAVDSLIIGVLASIGLAIIKSPYSVLIALIVGITNMIPYFGPFIGMMVGFLINIFFSPVKALVVLIFLFLLQQFDAWYLDPKLIGGKVGLSPFLVIFAVTLGGGLYGPIGMVLAVPIMAVLKIYIDKFLKNKKII